MRQGVTEENLFNFEPMWLEQAMIFIDRLTAGNDDAPSQWSEPRNVAYYGKYAATRSRSNELKRGIINLRLQLIA